MNWLIENWYVLLALIVAVGALIWLIFRFFNLPTKKQVEKVKEWLIWACVEAEKRLQSGTGQLKLRQVYDMFCAVPAFTWIAKIVSFKTFSKWVSDALVTAKKMLIENSNLAEYVYGEKMVEEVNKLKEQLEV